MAFETKRQITTGGSGAVDSVNGQTGVVILTTDDISEGISNFYVPALTEGSVPFAGVDGQLTEDNTNLFWDDTNNALHIGNPTIYIGTPNDPFAIEGDIDDFFELSIRNKNTGGTASSEIIFSNDIDDGTYETGTFLDVGIVSSVWNADPLKPNSSYIVAHGGEMLLQTMNPSAKIYFSVGDDSVESEIMYINNSGVKVQALRDVELAPALEAIDWTATGGWSAGTGQLVLITDVGISTIEPATPLTITPGTTYKIEIEASGIVGNVDYTLGGVSSALLINGTNTGYVTADTTDDLIISGAIGAEATITSLSVRALIDNTGDMFVEGNLILGSGITTVGDNVVMDIAGNGQVDFPLFPTLPNAYPTNPLEATNKSYVDALLTSGARFVGNVRAATVTALPACTYANGALGVGATLTGNSNGALADQDDVTLVQYDHLLVKDQAALEHNGAYELTTVGDAGNPFVLTRVTNYDVSAEIVTGTFFTVLEGTVNTLSQYSMITDATIVVGTTDIEFAQLSAPIVYTASNGIQLTANDFSSKLNAAGAIGLGGVGTDELKVNVDNSTIDISSNNIQVKDNGITFSKIQTIPTTTLLGRSTAATGNVESITIGAGLSLSGGSLSSTVTTSPITVANSTTLYSSGLISTGTGTTGNNIFGVRAGMSGTAITNSNVFGPDAGNGATGTIADVNWFGRGAGYQATNALASNFFGANAGNGASAGSYSNFIGAAAGYLSTNGYFSNFIGRDAGRGATNANNSIFMGYRSGYIDTVNNTTSGFSSIAIGDLSGTGGFSNSIALGYGAVNTATNQLLIGSSYTQLNMRGVNYTMPSANAVGQLTNDGSGNLSFTEVSVPQNLVVTAPFTKTSSTVFSNITGLSATVVSGQTYKFEAILYTTSSNTMGVKSAISGTATATSIIYEGWTANTTPLAKTRATALGASVGALTAATVATIRITGTITVNVGGTLTVQFAQNVSGASASTVLPGSTLTVTKI